MENVINSGNVFKWIMEYENGDLDTLQELQLFSYLINNRIVWSLQGHYGRRATHLIMSGQLSKSGKILNNGKQA